MHYYDVMRTTLTIDDQLYRSVKASAATRGATVSTLVEEALTLYLARPPESSPSMDLVVVGGSGPKPGIEINRNAEVRATLDEGRSVDVLR